MRASLSTSSDDRKQLNLNVSMEQSNEGARKDWKRLEILFSILKVC